MKRTILSALILVIFFTSANSQSQGPEKRINLYGAYVFDDEVSAYDTYNYGFGGKIKAGFQYGAGIEFLPREDFGVELLYIGQMTEGQLNYYTSYYPSGTPFSLDLSLNYAMLGFNRYMQNPSSKVETFGGIMLGALFSSVKNPNNGESRSATKFTWGLRLGANIWASDRVAVKLQAQVLSAVQSVGGSAYFGTGGSGAGVSTYSSMMQFGIGGGLAFRLGN
ncbi:MAG: hypothetical protein ACHQNT_01980 [Bacteroidia bacterium]